MTKKSTWSIEAILRNRRKRLARRLYRDQPLFATSIIAERFSINYTTKDLFNDQLLCPGYSKRHIRGRHKSTGKSRLLYQIANNIKHLLSQDHHDQIELSKQVSRYKLLYAVRSKPWQVRINKTLKSGETINELFLLSNKYSHDQVKHFTSQLQHLIDQGSSRKQVLQYFDNFTSYDIN